MTNSASPMFVRAILEPLRQEMGRAIRVPSTATWEFQLEPQPTITARTVADNLAKNLYDDAAAVPSFLLALAYWSRSRYEGLTADLQVTGRAPEKGAALRHWRRSAFVMAQYRACAGEAVRFHLPPESEWRWPTRPHLNAPQGSRDRDTSSPEGSEHDLEMKIYRSRHLAGAFSRAVEPIEQFRRQLPLGLFDGPPAQATQYTPAKKSQVDLWAPAADGRTVHLFELKRPRNPKLGILPEAFYYAALLHYFRAGIPSGPRMEGMGEAGGSIRKAGRLVMWLLVPDLHPLLLHQERSPIEWVNAAFAPKGLEMRILPLQVEPSLAFDTNGIWPRQGN